MAGKKTSLPILPPGACCHNRDTEFLKLLAMLLMLTDHIGSIFFPQHQLLRIIGRSTFPLYAYCMSVGAVYTRSMSRYVSRVAIFAAISQPFYMLAFRKMSLTPYDFSSSPVSTFVRFYMDSWRDPSIMFTLLLALLVIWAIREKKLILALAVLFYCVLIKKDIDYKDMGVFLIVLFYLTANLKWAAPVVMAAFIVVWSLSGSGTYHAFGMSFTIQIFCLAALVPIYIPMKTGTHIPKYIHYAFYPAHLAALYLIRLCMNGFASM